MWMIKQKAACDFIIRLTENKQNDLYKIKNKKGTRI